MSTETKYANSNGVNIAYQVVGEGPLDLVFVMGWVSNLDYFWEEPHVARFLRRLASFSRLILFDKRGTGLSDRAVGVPGLEERMDDLRAVMDAVGSRRAAVLGLSEAGALCALFAATYPERVLGLVLIGCVPRRLWAPDYPWGATAVDRARRLEEIEHVWGSAEAAARDLERRAPSVAHDAWVQRWWATYLRQSASPRAAAAVIEMNNEIDVRPILPSIRAPTLVLHRSGDRTVHVEAGRSMAASIPRARYRELPGEDHLPFFGGQDAVLDEVERFLTGALRAIEPGRALLALVVAELVGPPTSSVPLRDQDWHELQDAFQLSVRQEVTSFQGRQLEADAGRVLASFDGPARAIRCACAIADAARSLGTEARVGVHAGECEVVGNTVAGVIVQMTRQVMASAVPGEVIVSGTVKDLVAGSDLRFEDLGSPASSANAGGPGLHRVNRGPRSSRPSPAGPFRPALPDEAARLTPREREVAALVARGSTNRQIGEALTIAESTAERHVGNILNKLGRHSRGQIAVWWAATHGVEPSGAQ